MNKRGKKRERETIQNTDSKLQKTNLWLQEVGGGIDEIGERD